MNPPLLYPTHVKSRKTGSKGDRTKDLLRGVYNINSGLIILYVYISVIIKIFVGINVIGG